jgi:hypothetical protein
VSTTETESTIPPHVLAAAGDDAHYLRAALRVGVPPGDPLPCLWVAVEAGCHRTTAERARKRLLRRGPEFWPWPDAKQLPRRFRPHPKSLMNSQRSDA